jgi:hypothetical protein
MTDSIRDLHSTFHGHSFQIRLNPKLTQMVVDVLIQKIIPFHRG